MYLNKMFSGPEPRSSAWPPYVFTQVARKITAVHQSGAREYHLICTEWCVRCFFDLSCANSLPLHGVIPVCQYEMRHLPATN